MKCTLRLVVEKVGGRKRPVRNGPVIETDLFVTSNVGNKYWFDSRQYEVISIDPTPEERRARRWLFLLSLIFQIVFSVLGSVFAAHLWFLWCN